MTHDVAIVSVSTSSSDAYRSEVVEVYVDVKNQRSYTESFGIVAFYSSSVTSILNVKNLEPNNKKRSFPMGYTKCHKRRLYPERFGQHSSRERILKTSSILLVLFGLLSRRKVGLLQIGSSGFCCHFWL